VELEEKITIAKTDFYVKT